MHPTDVIAALRFEPLLPIWLIAALAALALLMVALAAFRRARGTVLRLAAFATLLTWLAGPRFVQESLNNLHDIGLLVVDQSASMQVGERARLAKGGNGGFGNAHFKSSTNRAPRRANPGLPGEERWIRLRLKLIADAGLVGLPNAGKSTFLASVSAAKPKIADYPFTTLHPQLGVMSIDGREFVLADIPGLIEGAHEGAGLGDRFLGHVERCRVLLHLVDGTCEHAGEAYKTVRAELDAYGEGLTDKPEIVALSKVDVLTPEQIKQQTARLKRAAKKTPLILSAPTRQGVTEALRALARVIDDSRPQEPAQAGAWHP